MRLITLTTALLAALACCPRASASARQYSLFQDEALITDNVATRGPTLDEVKGLGADMIKVQLNWARVAPAGRPSPRGSTARPVAVPGLGPLRRDDRGDQGARLQGDGRARPAGPGLGNPRAATATASTRPNAREFGRFAEAAARRYPGVDVWTLWNEPNHPRYLFPQSTKGGRPVAPDSTVDGPRGGRRPAPRRRHPRPDPVRRAAPDREAGRRAEAEPSSRSSSCAPSSRASRSAGSTDSPTTRTRARPAR